jgi:3-oxoacyl-[acyl-carrier-protein] synthase II
VHEQFRGADALPRGVAGAEIADFNDSKAREFFPKNHRKSIKVMCREIQLGTVAAMLAFQDAGLDPGTINHDRMGVEFGANLMYSPPTQLNDPCWQCLDEQGNFVVRQWGGRGMPRMEPLWLLKYLPNMPACHIAIFLDARGPSNSVTQDEASGNLALIEAHSVIHRNAADVMIAGSTGARLHQFKTLHAVLWGELGYRSEDPASTCRPFDAERTGQALSEGACSFVLEEEEHARARGATILARYLGGGSSCVAPGVKDHHRLAAAHAMRAALRSAGLSPDDIGHINAHGVGELEADRAEAQAIHEVFGPRGATIPVTSLKGAMGNAGAGGGTIELAASLLGLAHGLIPPTLHCDHPDPACGLNVVRDRPLPTSQLSVLKLSFTRLGQASAVILQRTA